MPSGIYKRIKPVWNKGKKCPQISISKKGQIPWNKNMAGWTNNYKNAGFQKVNKYGKIRLGMKATKETIEKLRKSHIGKMKGENHPNWKRGTALLEEQIRKCFEYRQWRSDVFTRDNFTCQDCGKRGGDLEAHHIKEFSLILKENNIKTLEEAMNCEELWNINNGITLCKNCHNKTKHG